jgi:hypothetical protein
VDQVGSRSTASRDDRLSAAGAQCRTKESFNGNGAVVAYFRNYPTVVRIMNDTQGANNMSDHDEWTSYSHWGMFSLGLKS